MKKLFIETSSIIEYIHGNQQVVTIIDTPSQEIVSSYFCYSEIYEGLHHTESKGAHEATDNFFQHISYLYGLDRAIAEKFSLLRYQLRKKGKLIEDIDIYVAATCLVNDCVLLTENVKHFQRIPELILYEKGDN